MFSTADLADRASYGKLLCAKAAAYFPVERALDAGRMREVVPDWPLRRRAHLIREDLVGFGLDMPALEPEPVFAGVAAMLGATYVLEGSRLGGALVRRSVPAAFPTAYLSASSTTAWRDLILLLDARLVTATEFATAIAAACDTFALFERSGRRFY